MRGAPRYRRRGAPQAQERPFEFSVSRTLAGEGTTDLSKVFGRYQKLADWTRAGLLFTIEDLGGEKAGDVLDRERKARIAARKTGGK
jgi:hypothetical protein